MLQFNADLNNHQRNRDMNNFSTEDLQRDEGILFILSGPSGVGKDTILRRVIPRLSLIRTSISITTREPRPHEKEGIDYFFVTNEKFATMLEQGDMLEHAAVHGHFYGTPRSWVEEELNKGMDVILEIDVQGALQVRREFPGAILLFLAPPSWDELERRLRRRKTEDELTIHKRLENARHEMERIENYEYLVINDKLDEAVRDVESVIIAERLRPWRYSHFAKNEEE
jgi:guanylate kinase